LALCDIVALPPESRAALSPWREAAKRQVASEQRLTALKPPTERP
jgi:hypothetical protein